VRWRIQSGQNAGFVRSGRQEFQRIRVCTDSVCHSYGMGFGK
jgi:hypothetical protein